MFDSRATHLPRTPQLTSVREFYVGRIENLTISRRDYKIFFNRFLLIFKTSDSVFDENKKKTDVYYAR